MPPGGPRATHDINNSAVIHTRLADDCEDVEDGQLTFDTPTSSTAKLDNDASSTRPGLDMREKVTACRIQRGTINVFLLGLSFCFVFFCFAPTQSYMTKLNAELGFASMAMLYMVFGFSSLAAPWVIKKLGIRLALIVAGVPYIVYALACIPATPFTLLPASFVIGLGGALLWTSQGEYLAGASDPATVGFLSGLFFALLQIGCLSGNVSVSALVSLDVPIASVFLILAVVGCVGLVVMFFLGRIDGDTAVKSERSPKAVFSLFFRKDFALLQGVIMLGGISQSLYSGKYPPTLATEHVGLFAAVIAVASIVGGLAIGKLSDKFGRTFGVLLSLSLWLGGAVASLAGYMESGSLAVATQPSYLMFITTAVLFGAADAGLNTQLMSLLSQLFVSEGKTSAAFAGYRLSQSLVQCMGLAIGPFLSLFQFGVYVCGVSWMLAIATYLLFHFKVLRERQHVGPQRLVEEEMTQMSDRA